MLIRFTPNLILLIAFRPLLDAPYFNEIGAGICRLKKIFAKCAKRKEEKLKKYTYSTVVT